VGLPRLLASGRPLTAASIAVEIRIDWVRRGVTLAVSGRRWLLVGRPLQKNTEQAVHYFLSQIWITIPHNLDKSLTMSFRALMRVLIANPQH
jgi:hypothetical protein